MSKGGCLVELILASIIALLLIWAATHTFSELPGTLDPVLNHEAYP